MSKSRTTSIPGLSWRYLNDAEFDAFSTKDAAGSFQQSSYMKHLAKMTNAKADADLIGVVDTDGVIVSAAMIVYTPSRFGKAGSIWCGPLCDPDNQRLLAATSDAIREAAKRAHAYSVSCWPNNVFCKHDSFGAPEGSADSKGVKDYKQLNWRHNGFDRGYGSVVNRWVYVKDLSDINNEKELLASYNKNTKRNVKIAEKSCVRVRQIGRDELETFHAICDLSSARQGFQNRSLDYARDFYDSFGELAHFMVAEIHLDDYLKSWEKKLADARKEIATLEPEEQDGTLSDKRASRLRTARQNESSAINRIAKAKEYISEDGEVVPVAAALFVEYSGEMVYLMSGSNDKYAKFYAPTALQEWAMMFCVEHDLPRYNFYGISGYFDNPDDPGHGVLEFKQGFNGYVEELMGEFTLPVNRVRYAFKQTAEKLLHR